MLIQSRQSAASLIEDPAGLAAHGSVDGAIAAILRLASTEQACQEIERAAFAVEQAECPVIHRFAPGLYIREAHLPKGSFCLGHYHVAPQLNVMLKGRMTVCNENGTISDMVAPLMYVGKPGRKFGYMREDVVWQNIYATNETDIELLELMFTAKSAVAQQDQYTRNNLPATVDQCWDRADYQRVLAEAGIPHAQALAETARMDDRIPFPDGGYKVAVADSRIEGKGLFATATIEAGEMIAPAAIGAMRTPAGRYTNHSQFPNATMREFGDDVWLVALRDIRGCAGGRVGEEITIDYRVPLRIRGRL